jgi:hypothetical protein
MKIDRIIEKDGRKLCERHSAIGIAKGNKISDGVDTGEESLVFLVREKKEVSKKEFIPKKINGEITDIIEAGGPIGPLHKKKYRPVMGGISGKYEKGSACSIGLIAFKGETPVALTNEHCCHYRGNRKGEKFIQPSPSDGGNINDAIGTISNDPRISSSKVNKIDSDYIPLGVGFDLAVKGIESYPKKVVEPKVGMTFVKIGRTTGITTGTISHINATSFVRYPERGVCQFYPTVWAIQNNYDLVNGGDSGSCCFTPDGVLMQTFAAAPNLAIFIPMSSVVEELGITLEKAEPITGYVAINRDWQTDKEILIDGLNLRKEPRISNNVIKKLKLGDKIKVIEYAGFSDRWHWLKIII